MKIWGREHCEIVITTQACAEDCPPVDRQAFT